MHVIYRLAQRHHARCLTVAALNVARRVLKVAFGVHAHQDAC